MNTQARGVAPLTARSNERKKHGDPLAKMEVNDFVLMYQNGKGYVGIGKVKEKWNGKGYKSKLVYRGYEFDEYRIPIDWFYDARKNPFQIGYVSSGFLASVQKSELLKRVKAIVQNAMKGIVPRPTVDEADDDYVPDGKDHRQKIARQIYERRGQKSFRDKLKKRYGAACQITGCTIFDIVEAAHICPYLGEKDNRPENGLLLRADLHTLFDLDLIGVHPHTLKIVCSDSVADQYVADLVGKKLICRYGNRPSIKALNKRFDEFKSRA